MRLKDGYKLHPLGEDYILIGESSQRINFNSLVTLNATAAYLWQSVEGKEFDVHTLTQLLVEEYDVDAATAQHDAQATIEQWEAAKVVE